MTEIYNRYNRLDRYERPAIVYNRLDSSNR
jgi:hypothetical protein